MTVETMSLRDRVATVQDRIDAAARRAGRDAAEITLVAVTKTFSADVVKAALDAGIRHVGENRAQELKEKVAVVAGDVHWHFIGPLQTNKGKLVVGSVALIHSVDRLGLAEAIARRARALEVVQDVLIEVNVAGQPEKHGVEPPRALALARAVAQLEGVRVRGFMTMPPYPDDPEDSRPHYRALAELGDLLSRELPGATQLSMGMTRDFEVGIAEGATLVRVGEALFGPRRR